jgi:hypothetical protein
MRLSDLEDKERVSLRVREMISEMYGEEFNIRSWPQQNYRDTLWWYEKLKIPSTVASYFLKVDNKRGPNLYAGISIEKGLEDGALAEEKAIKRNESIERYRLDKNWDWYRFLSSFKDFTNLVSSLSNMLKCELYFWVEFDEGRTDSQYFVIDKGELFWRGGFKPIEWDNVYKFLIKSYPKSWENVYLARAFTLEECTPQLEEKKIMEVFEAMRPIRDLWRGLSSH